MPYRIVPFAKDYIYHVFNRGVEKRIIFSDKGDYQRFLDILYYYQFLGPKPSFSSFKRFKTLNFGQTPKIVEVICYCLMPNHVHLLIKEIKIGGIQEYMSKIINSYTKYYNIKHDRVGHLFQGQFKAVLVESDEQLIHLSRYIHLNPYVAELVKSLSNYNYSSYLKFIGKRVDKICTTDFISSLFQDSEAYLSFVEDYQDYAKSLESIKHLLVDDEV